MMDDITMTNDNGPADKALKIIYLVALLLLVGIGAACFYGSTYGESNNSYSSDYNTSNMD